MMTVDVMRCLVAGMRPGQIAERTGLSLADVQRRIDASLEAFRRECAWIASLEMDVRLARLDAVIAAVFDDLDSDDTEKKYRAAHAIRETEAARDRLLLGARQVKLLDKELGDGAKDGGSPRPVFDRKMVAGG